jgi:hypothetical protein
VTRFVGLVVVAIVVHSLVTCPPVAATTATPPSSPTHTGTCTPRPGMSGGCGPDPITHTPNRTETPTPRHTPTCTPHSAPYHCASDESLVCPPDPCGYCQCVENTPSVTGTATPTCPPPPAAPTCATGTTYLCHDECRVDCYCATPTPSATASSTATRTEIIVGCCQPPDSCYRPSTALLFCDRDQRGGETYYKPYMCNADSGRCEIPVPTLATTTPTVPVASVTPTATPASCVGDCNADGVVRINELIRGVNIVMGTAPLSACPAINCEPSLDDVSVNCAVSAVANALNGCSAPMSPVQTATPTAPPTCVPTLGAPSYCATHCPPCPTIRAGCYAVACRDCIEIPVCEPNETCVPWGPANPDCCSCGTPTATAVP